MEAAIKSPAPETEEDLSGFETCLSAVPRLMLLGPGGPRSPPSDTLFDDNGILKWELLTRNALWGT